MRSFGPSHSSKTLCPAAALLALLLGVARAQPAIISGQVFDPGQGQGVEYANVVLFDAGDSSQVTGTATTEGGRFVLPPVEPGRYYIEVSFIGYTSSSVYDVEVASGAKLDLGLLEIRSKPLAVEGAEAVAEKPTFKYEVDKKVIEVSKMPTVQSGTAVDALENTPSVQVDIEGNVSLRGSENFTVQVDGKPTVLEPSEALRQIPATTIDRIEVITNPSANYDPDGVAGIVNVILKKQQVLGVSALASLNAGLRNRYGGDLLLGYRQGIVNAHLGGDYNRRPWYSELEYDNLTWDSAGSETLRVTGAGDNTWQSQFGGARGGLELTFGQRDVSSVNGRYGMYRSGNTAVNDVTERFMPADTSRAYVNDGRRGWGGRYIYLYADHQHSFDTTEHRVLLSVSHSRSLADIWSSTEVLDDAEAVTSGRKSEEEGPQQRTRFEAEYTLPLRQRDKFEAGYNGRLESTDQEYAQYLFTPQGDSYEIQPANSHPYFGARYIHAAFATYEWKWQKLGVKLGMRGEYGERVIEVEGLDVRYDLARWDYFPSAHVSLGTGFGQFTTSYSRRIQRPWPWLLRPFETWQSERFKMRGNPELLPQYTNAFEVGYQVPFGRNMVSLEGFYRASTDAFEWTQAVDTSNPGVLVMQMFNAGAQNSLGVELMTNLTLFELWTLNLTGSLYDYTIEGDIQGESFSRNSFNWHGRLGNDFRLPTGTRLSFNLFYSSPSVSAQGSNQGHFITDAAIQQSLLNRALTITLRARDLFGTGGWQAESEGRGFDTQIKYFSEWPVVTLSLRYNFNNFRFDPKMRGGDEDMQMQGGGTGPQG